MTYKGQIVKRNAHPAIVDEQTSFFAFNALSDVDIDGTPIEREKRVVRYTQYAEGRERIEALLAGTRANGKMVYDVPYWHCICVTTAYIRRRSMLYGT